jgi:hypothetical protein
MSPLFHLAPIIVYVLVVGAVLSGCLKILMFIRAKRMRALAARWGLRYIGPAALKFSRVWFSSSNNFSPLFQLRFPRVAEQIG